MANNKIDMAVAKITDEAAKINTNFAIFLEEHLTSICVDDYIAEKLLAEDKNLKTIHDKIEKEAKETANKGQGQVRIIGKPDAEIYSELEEYYGIGTEQIKAEAKKIDVLDLI